MAYPDDKSMTKIGRYVHVPVMRTGYTLAMAIVLELEVHLREEGSRSQAVLVIAAYVGGFVLLSILLVLNRDVI